MATVTLDPKLAREIEPLAGDDEGDLERFVEEAVRAYLLRAQREKIRAETRAFYAQRETLNRQYLDQYVAMHQGAVIDHDPDLRTLHLRVFDRLGHTPVLLKRVTDAPEHELVVRSPRLEPRDA